MKKKFLIYVLTFVLILPCAMLLSGCFSNDKKNNQTETPQASTTTINFYYQNGNDLKSSINVDLSTTYYCEISIENANFYETSGYYTEKDGQGIAVYDVVNNYTPAFKSFCEGKTVVNVYEYKVDKTYKLTLVYNGRTENRICKVADNISLSVDSKYGYSFEGWSENPNDDFLTIESIYAGKYTDDVTLYAIFKPISFYINYSTIPTNSEYCNESKRVTYDQILTIEKPYEKIYSYLTKKIIKGETQFTEILEGTIQDSYKRLIEPSIEREIRADLTEKASEQAIKVFGKNAKQLLLGAPIKNITVMGFDPAYRTGCKIAVIDDTGKVLDTATVYPTEPQNDVEGAKKILKELIKKHNVNMIAIGNGTASRESEKFVSDMLKEIPQKVYYTIVSEAGASVYSASKLATEEYPDINVSIRGAISIARRLQDPLTELVKIDPKAIGVGQYQHDVDQKKLSENLTGVVEDAVNSVGVDVNTATPSLLSYVSGINKTIAKNIVTYRDENGKLKERKELLKVPKLGKSAFEQCAGFIRIFDGKNPLETTGVHPESYEVAEKLLNKVGNNKNDLLDKEKLEQIRTKLANLDIEKTSKELEIGELTLKDIIDDLSKPGRDPREEMPKPVLRADVLKFEDLREGQILTGTVRNVTDFGAFVDVGVKHDGLVHISELSNSYVKNPSDVVSVGDVVKVKVIGIDQDRQKVKLSMKI